MGPSLETHGARPPGPDAASAAPLGRPPRRRRAVRRSAPGALPETARRGGVHVVGAPLRAAGLDDLPRAASPRGGLRGRLSGHVPGVDPAGTVLGPPGAAGAVACRGGTADGGEGAAAGGRA